MPKIAINYSQTIIYKLCCKDPTITDIYVGHTTDFNNRKRLHKSKCNNQKDKKYNLYVYQFIRDNDGWENFDMIQIEAYSCNDRREAKVRERYWIESLNASLNCNIPTQTHKEWSKKNKDYYSEYREKNKDKICEYNKNYYEQNKEQIAEKTKNYYEQNKEQIAEKAKNYYEQNKEQIAEKAKNYYEKNKDEILEQNKNYYDENKNKILEKRKEKITCECGSIFSIHSKYIHEKTLKHQDYTRKH